MRSILEPFIFLLIKFILYKYIKDERSEYRSHISNSHSGFTYSQIVGSNNNYGLTKLYMILGNY